MVRALVSAVVRLAAEPRLAFVPGFCLVRYWFISRDRAHTHEPKGQPGGGQTF
jgi:hypothetical protein